MRDVLEKLWSRSPKAYDREDQVSTEAHLKPEQRTPVPTLCS